MHEDALAAAQVVQPELARRVLALDRARLHAVELDRRARQNCAGDLRPKRAEDDCLEQILVLGVCVERGVGGSGGTQHEAELREGREEVLSQGDDVADCRRRDEVL